MEASILKNEVPTPMSLVDARLAEFMGYENIERNDCGATVGIKDGKIQFIPNFSESWECAMSLVSTLNEKGYVLQLEQYTQGGSLYWDATFVSADGHTEYEYAQATSPLTAITMAAYAMVINYNQKFTVTSNGQGAKAAVLPFVTINDEQVVISAIKKVGSITPLVANEEGKKYMFYLFVDGFQYPFRQYFGTLNEAVEAKSEVLDKIYMFCTK